MSQYDNTNRGVLFDNDRKESDNHPDMTGTLNINGVDHWFSGWWKNGNKGEFLSLSIGKPKDQQRQAAPPPPPAPERRGNRPSQRPQPQGNRAPARSGGGFDDMDDNIPY